MPRRSMYVPLRVLLNGRLVGHLAKEPGGSINFRYDESWLAWEHALPVSLSLPLSESGFRGEPVVAVFENLLPDSDALRRRIADTVGARGTDAYGLLAAIGRDCIGALQFIDDSEEAVNATGEVKGDVVDDETIDKLLRSLPHAPLGLSRDDEFRISVAGAREKTALLRHDGKWIRPPGTTPTTHLLKPRIGELPNGIDLCDSVENEFYCLKLVEAFGLPVNRAKIKTFGETKALVIERFDRKWTADGLLLRLPQEDCCQALSVLPSRKYQNEGGPGMADILDLLKGSDTPEDDQGKFFKAQILFWLLGATDGHAKNFSIFIGPGGSYRLTPLYDVLTTQPILDRKRINRKHVKLAMSVGKRRHYRVDKILGRHFVQTAERSGLPKSLARSSIEEIADSAKSAMAQVESILPADFPEYIQDCVQTAISARLRDLALSPRP